MVIYYHTSHYVFAVANDRIASVVGSAGEECPVSLIGAKLLGALDENLEPIPPGHVRPGQRLKFELGSVGFITDSITRIESVSSLSVPPAPRESAPPETVRIRDPIPTVPEIKIPRGS